MNTIPKNEIHKHPATGRNSFFAFLLTLLLFFAQGSRADTIVCGIISGQTWTKVGSPYRVTCDVTVNSLTITEGVMVIFEGNYVFQVNGRLTATGTMNEQIVFTSTNCWQGILFSGQIQPSLLSHCRIESACNSGVRIVNASPVIENCDITGNTATYGGGLYVQLTQNHTPTLANCSVSGNSSINSGGGVYASLAAGTLTFSNCTISGNALNRNGVVGSYEGGGIFRETAGGQMVLDLCDINYNTNWSRCTALACNVTALGGGIYSAGDLILRNCVFVNNRLTASEDGVQRSSQAYGGAVYQTGSSLYAANCLFAGNVSDATGSNPTERGSALYLNAGVGAIVNSTMVNGNAAVTAIYRAGGTLTVTNSIIYYNNPSGLTYGPQVGGTVTIAYSDVQNGFSGVGNIDLNPGFIEGICHPYVLDPSISPCIDAGDPDPTYSDACFFGDFSLGGARNDIGAYGGPGACLWGPCTSTNAPAIIGQSPSPLSSCLGQSASFFVSAIGTPPLSYQWWFGSVPLPSQTNSTMVLTNLQFTNAGVYRAVVSNPYGSTNSSDIQLNVFEACIDIHMYAGLTIAGQAGQMYVLKYTTDMSNTNFATWTSLATNTMGSSNWFYLDTESPFSPQRFYGVRLQP